jgi:23S rRNA pseudouridine1911/1915/1917 synthase
LPRPRAPIPEILTTTRLRVDAADAGPRLDVFIARRVPGLSRARAQALIASGHVAVNGAAARASRSVQPGDEIVVQIPPAQAAVPAPESIPLTIVYQDTDVAVIDKPAGLVVHPGAGRAGGTLVNALLGAIPDLSGIGGVARPGIVHRLDKDTSGLIVVAKNDAAHRELSAQIGSRRARREYVALVRGRVGWIERTVRLPIGRHPTHRKRMAVVESGRPAETRFSVVSRHGRYTLVECRLATGRTHQIRVHAQAIGHPIVGDPQYGHGPELGLPRQFLHAARLAFAHPRTGEAMTFVSPLPADLRDALERATAAGAAPEM